MSDLSTISAAPFLIAVAGLAALAVSQLLARLAIAGCWLPDRPNGRSSHFQVTPRSGGVAIVSAWLIGMAIVAAFSPDAAFGAGAPGLMILVGLAFVLGLLDDAFDLRPIWKLGGQIAVAVLFVVLFGAVERAPLPVEGDFSLGWAAAPLTVFWIVGFMNAFNFMDGVNGIAAACGAFALFALSLAAVFFGAPLWAAVAGLAAVALVAFLPFNLPRGRLFMGDNGSQAVGYLIAIAAVGAMRETGGAASALFMPVAMLPFIFDVTFTLVHRAARGRNIVAAHREHLYQLLLRLGHSHAGVTAIYLGLTALSTTVAILMLRLTPDRQWLAPAFAILALLAPACLLFRRAAREGLLDERSAPAREEPQFEVDVLPHTERFPSGVTRAAE